VSWHLLSGLPKWAQGMIEKLQADVDYYKDRAARYHRDLLDRGEYKFDDSDDSESFRVILHEDDEGKYLEIQTNGNTMSIEPRAANVVWARIKTR